MAVFRRMNRGIALLLAFSPLPALAASKVLPVLNHTIASYGVVAGNSPRTIDLAQYFGTESVDDQAVRFTSQFNVSGTPVVIDMALFSNRTPVTRTNFLKYVSDGDYTNSFIHRSVPGFVIQGGGFRIANNSIAPVPTDAPIVNEFGISNTLGTISMAKLGTDPNSATSQWFISLGDNSANLDVQNSGFAVFGRVTKTTFGNAQTFGDGATFPIYNYSNIDSALGSLPLFYTHTSAGLQIGEFELFPQVGLVPLTATDAGESPQLTYSIVSVTSNGIASASLSGSALTVTPSASQTAATTIVVRATDSVGNTVDTSFKVSSGQTYAQWRAANFTGGNATNDAVSGPNADPDSDGVSNLQLFVSGLTPGATAKPPVTAVDNATDSTRRPRFTFPFRSDISGATFTLERSATLDGASWTTVPYTEISHVPVSSGSVVNTWVIQPADAVTATPAFYRVKFTVE